MIPIPIITLLVVDAGNTRVKFGLFSETEPVDHRLPACDLFVAPRIGDPDFWQTVHDTLTIPDFGSWAVISGSNVQQMERVIAEWPVHWPRPQMLMERHTLPIAIDVDQPERVGIDRLLDAIAANVLRAAGQPAIVIDIGTATTVNAVSKSGTFVGGAILSGPEMSARALHEYTAVLPDVTLADLSDEEPPVIGRNTQAAIKSGLYWGHWQAVLGICERMQRSLGCPPEPLVLLTGGAARLYADRLPPEIRYEPHLTLQGLAIAALHLLAQGDQQ